MKSVGARRQIDGRADRGRRAKRRLAAPLAGQLQHHVAAHRVTHQRHPLKAKSLCVVAQHHAHVGGQTRVVERGGQRFRAATGAHVHADDVPAGGPCAGCDSLDVAGVRRAFEPVDHDQRKSCRTHSLGLPMAMAKHAAAVSRVHFNGFRSGFEAESRPGKIVPHNGLHVAIGEAAARHKSAQIRRQTGGHHAKRCFLMGFWNHEDSPVRPIGLIAPPSGEYRLGRLVGIEPTTS